MPAIETDPTQQLGKFVVIHGSPPALPGCCLLCSTAKQNIRYIDPRRDLEWHGTIYLCEECVVEMSQNLGMLDAEASTDLLDDNRILTERITEANSRIEELEQTVDLLSQRRLSDRVISSNPDVVTGQDSLPGDVKNASDDDDGTKGTEHELAEQVNEQGPDDVPGLTGDNGAGFTI